MPVEIITPFTGIAKNRKNAAKQNKQQNQKSDVNPLKQPRLAHSGFIGKNIVASKYQKEYLQIAKYASPALKRQMKLAHNLANKYVIYGNATTKTAKITYDHYFVAYLKTALDFAKEVKEGKNSVDKETSSHVPSQLSDSVTPYMWRIENIDGVIDVLESEIKQGIKELELKSKKDAPVTSLEIDKQIMEEVNLLLRAASNVANANIDYMDLNDSFVFATMLTSDDKRVAKRVNDFIQRLSMRTMASKKPDNGLFLPYYSSISKNALKNADRNFNIFITYSKEDEKAPGYFIQNLFESLKSDETFSGCKNLRKDNVEMVVYNEYADFDVMANEIKSMAKNPDKQYIVLARKFDSVMRNSPVSVTSDGAYLYNVAQLEDIFKHKPKNVHYVFIADRDVFYGPLLQNEVFAKYFDDFQSMQIPIMDANATKEQLNLTKSLIEKEIGMELTPEALSLACDLASSDGSKYDKTVKLIKNIAAYCADKKILTKQGISEYLENTKTTDKATKESSYEIIFDTKTGLDDIIGSPMTKQQAADVVYEIQNMPQTKGYILYNVDGEGGGRLKCAKAIAGEAKIPMVKISASDFAIRELDTINQDPVLAIETKMTKLMNLIKTQAQASPNKTVMLFISDFDRFSSNPLYGISSIYEQQAFKKLQKEMQRARKEKDYNLIVMGSSDMPELTSENIIRPGLFMDNIAIYSPRLKSGVKEIIESHAAKNNYKIAGEDEKEKQKTLKHFASICLGFSYVDIIDLLDKANIIAQKSSKNEISIEDINEAFLTKINGVTNRLAVDDKHKEVIIRHEGGHALTLQFMYNLLKEQNDTLRIPSSIQNIALDPRGDFLGCVYSSRSDENTTENNLETILSEIVCCFGGNSSEEHFYNMEGSFGISQDMQIANAYARLAVLRMGLGAKSGYYIPDIDPASGLPVFADDESSDYVDDIKIFLKNAKTLSDKIIECYDGFLREFSSKNISKFATGKCIITGEEFAQSLKKWEAKQTPQKKREIQNLKKEALAIIQYTKLGKRYGVLSKYNPIYRMN